jgi:hypothetical protein
MTLIGKDPVGEISFSMENGKIKNLEFHFPDLDHDAPCYNCGTLTRKTRMGFVECAECLKYEDCCKNCQFAIPCSTYHANGNDLEDYVSEWIACGMRNDMGNVLKGYNPNSHFTCWGISLNEKKQCYQEKVASKGDSVQ